MSKKNRSTVFSTDPEEEKPKPSISLPANPLAPIRTLQQNHPVRVHRSRAGRGGKTVSVITGVRTTAAGRKALLKHLKNKLGTGGTIKDDEIEIQGEQRERIVELLNELGYQAKVAGG
ncbi:MAG: stress response translation initiation inhibitor YciH [Caldilineaceae bacterium]|nr:stress response translation initiation inhibitor YciH [Caldilineaceae bacterium]